MNQMDKILSNTYGNAKEIKKAIIKHYGTLEYIDEDGSLYHKIVRSNVSLNYKIEAIDMLVANNINPNILDSDGNTYIHTFMKYNKSADINYLLRAAFNIGYDVNIQNSYGESLLHIAIDTYTNIDEIIRLMIILDKDNFDFLINDNYGHNLVEYIFMNDKYTYHQKEILKANIDNILTKRKNNENRALTTKPNIDNISKYGFLLNDKDYDSSPAICRDKEIDSLIISLATDKKMPILVGPSGVGKTTIVDELTYRIKNGNVPKFLENRYIFEVHFANVIAGAKYRGDFEDHLKEIFRIVIKYNMILFIDEFHMAFGTGASEYDKSDAASMIKTYIDRYNIKVIGATTYDEYEEYMAHDALKRRFDVIKVNELDKNKLFQVASDIINNLAMQKHYLLSNEVIEHFDYIIDVLLELTQDKNRKYDDKVYNPDLIISIIDRMFAYVYVEDQIELQIKHIIMAISDNNRIYDYSKEEAIKKLNYIDINDTKVNNNVIDFNEYKKKHVLV